VAAGTQELAVSGAGLAGPVWSSDGQWLVYQARRHDHWDLFARPAWGGEAVALTEPVALAGKAPDNLSPTFSPDGQWVTFASNRGGAWNLYVMRRDGSELRPLFAGGLPAGLSLHYDGNAQRALAWGK
jgi:Tol biopolymer transport system component